MHWSHFFSIFKIVVNSKVVELAPGDKIVFFCLVYEQGDVKIHGLDGATNVFVKRVSRRVSKINVCSNRYITFSLSFIISSENSEQNHLKPQIKYIHRMPERCRKAFLCRWATGKTKKLKHVLLNFVQY
jgi:hypothetical protein